MVTKRDKENIMANVLWLSRHSLTTEQMEGLEKASASILEFAPLDVVSENTTFSAHAEKAADEIIAIAQRHGVEIIAGVFPAHVAIELYRSLGLNDAPMFMLCPVSVPAPAMEGETRGGGFIHSHWELFCAE